MKNFETNSLKIEVTDAGDRVTMKLLGTSEERFPGKVLNPYFSEIVDGLTKPILVDFSGLEYINSSTVEPIHHLIKLLNKKAINTTLLFNTDISWQLSSHKALGMVCRKLEYIEVTKG